MLSVFHLGTCLCSAPPVGSWVNITNTSPPSPPTPPLPLPYITNQCVLHLLIFPSIHFFMYLSPLFFLSFPSFYHPFIYPSFSHQSILHLLIHCPSPCSIHLPTHHSPILHPPIILLFTHYPPINHLLTYPSDHPLSIHLPTLYLSINVSILHQSIHLSSIHHPPIHIPNLHLPIVHPSITLSPIP